LRTEFIEGDAAGLDYHAACFRITGAYIAARPGYEIIFGIPYSLNQFFFQSFQHLLSLPFQIQLSGIPVIH
jgi:hypothetical protein